nr:PREDICTED: uncharacterized protein LOC107399126 [Tribolium castaneum]|eukprot:XP_015840314.1 PREDICTED: uncharacterized protein LOC107399126 [Tribolium castaneum]
MIFMKKEADEDQPVIPLKQFKKRVLQATGISNHLYKSAKKELSEIESGEKGSFSISKKPRLTRPVPKSTFTKGEKQAIRRIIHQYHVTEKGRPTLKGSKTEDYHDKINWENFEKWVTTQLQPNLPPRFVLVLDNASYHNRLVEAAPTSKSKKRRNDWVALGKGCGSR